MRACVYVCVHALASKVPNSVKGRVDGVNPGWNLPPQAGRFTSLEPPAPHSHIHIFKSNLFRHVDGEHIADLEEELQGCCVKQAQIGI